MAIIFEFCLDQKQMSTPSASKAPLLLGLVCRSWRAVLLSTPALWTTMSLHFYDDSIGRRSDKQKVISALEHWLKYSTPMPIFIEFIDHRAWNRDSDPLVEALITKLTTFASRWRSLSFQFSCRYFPILFDFTSSTKLTSLEHFAIHGDMRGGLISVDVPRHLDLTSATRLKSLSYTGTGRFAKDHIKVGWEGLTHLFLDYDAHHDKSFTISRFYPQLNSCENLTTLSLGIGQPGLLRRGNERILLPHLDTLRVRRLSPFAHARSVIDPLTLPQLKTLEIDATALLIWNNHWHDRQFSELLARSACMLQELYIKDVDFPTEELFRCFDHAPHLTNIVFDPSPRCYRMEDVVKRLTIQPSDAWTSINPCLPNMQRLALSAARESCLNGILEMILSRQRIHDLGAAIAPIQCFELSFYDHFHTREDDRRTVIANFEDSLRHMHSPGANTDMQFAVVIHALYDPTYLDV